VKDRLSRQRRSWNMSRIRGKDTTPEKVVRSLLHRMGYRFRLHVRIPIPASAIAKSAFRNPHSKSSTLSTRHSTLSTRFSTPDPRPAFFVRPDIVLRKYKTAIFVHGCFWHRHKGCKNCTTPTNRREWWLAKLNGNAVRDKVRQAALKKLGWRVIVIWECELEKLDSFVGRLAPRLR
jgi:DNA mismatch endonuclease, patch repair protein